LPHWLPASLAAGWDGSSAAHASGVTSTQVIQHVAEAVFVFCLFSGMGSTADCLSEEKREGTLGLLFLTDLKGYDIVFGKLLATSLHTIYGLLATFPIFSLVLLIGGVRGGELLQLGLALLNTLFFSLSVDYSSPRSAGTKAGR
jgi:ABC-type transport system involved in cytochrome c biogenesis permease component